LYAFKCTAESRQPSSKELITELKGSTNSHFIAPTVELLSTGIDIPNLNNVIFFKYVESLFTFGAFKQIDYIANILAYNATLMRKTKNQCNRLKVILVERGKPNLWLAEQLNVNKTTDSKWCTNDIKPSIETLFKIAEILEIDAGKLLTTKNKKHE
jgi:putative transcriptional regulator